MVRTMTDKLVKLLSKMLKKLLNGLMHTNGNCITQFAGCMVVEGATLLIGEVRVRVPVCPQTVCLVLK